MDGPTERATLVTLDDVPPCCLEDEPIPSRFPKAELCVAGSAVCGFLIATGTTMIILHYTYESREGFHSLLEHLQIASNILGLSFIVLAGVIALAAFMAFAIWKVMRVLEMAHRYQEHREFCVYEELRQSFRSQQSLQSSRCMVDMSRYSIADSKDTPRK